MKLERKHKLKIILGIALLFILYGILDGIFKFNVEDKTVSNVGMILMVIAFGLLFSDKKPRQHNTNQTNIDSSIVNTDTPIEINNTNQEENSKPAEDQNQNQSNESGVNESDVQD